MAGVAENRDRGDAGRDAMNKGLKEEERRLKDPEGRPPHSEKEQDTPTVVRPTTPQEDNEEDIAHLENPPQTEGPRERSNDAV